MSGNGVRIPFGVPTRVICPNKILDDNKLSEKADFGCCKGWLVHLLTITPTPFTVMLLLVEVFRCTTMTSFISNVEYPPQPHLLISLVVPWNVCKFYGNLTNSSDIREAPNLCWKSLCSKGTSSYRNHAKEILDSSLHCLCSLNLQWERERGLTPGKFKQAPASLHMSLFAWSFFCPQNGFWGVRVADGW